MLEYWNSSWRITAEKRGLIRSFLRSWNWNRAGCIRRLSRSFADLMIVSGSSRSINWLFFSIREYTVSVAILRSTCKVVYRSWDASHTSFYVLQHKLVIVKVKCSSSSYCRLEEVSIRLKLWSDYVGLPVLLVWGPHPQTVLVCRKKFVYGGVAGLACLYRQQPIQLLTRRSVDRGFGGQDQNVREDMRCLLPPLKGK